MPRRHEPPTRVVARRYWHGDWDGRGQCPPRRRPGQRRRRRVARWQPQAASERWAAVLSRGLSPSHIRVSSRCPGRAAVNVTVMVQGDCHGHGRFSCCETVTVRAPTVLSIAASAGQTASAPHHHHLLLPGRWRGWPSELGRLGPARTRTEPERQAARSQCSAGVTRLACWGWMAITVTATSITHRCDFQFRAQAGRKSDLSARQRRYYDRRALNLAMATKWSKLLAKFVRNR